MADIALNIVTNISGATEQINDFTAAMRRATAAVSQSGRATATAGANISNVSRSVNRLSKSTTNAAGAFGKLTKSLGRIAFYRAIRSAIRYVTESFKQGLEAAYNWSKTQGGENAKLAKAMDNLSAASGKMKLQLGAAFGGLIVAIEPVLMRIIDLVTAAADAITQFFAILNGQGLYKKAVGGLDQVGSSAGGAAKKVKGLLASWDELNVIGKETGGGGGGSSGSGYTGDYEWAEIESDWAELFASGNFFGIGQKVGEALGNVAERFTNFLQRPEVQNFGINLAETLNGVVSDESNWYKVGEAIGTAIGTVTKWICDFFDNVDWPQVWESIKAFVKGVKDGIEKETGVQFNKPYWETLNEKLFPENYQIDFENPFDGIKEDLERMWEDTKLNVELTVTALVKLARSGWTTVSEWVAKYGKSPAEALVKLVKKGWTTVYEWVKKYTGATYSKAVQLAKSGWTTVSAWVSKYVGGTVSKGVSLLKSGWTTVSGWVQTYIGGTVSKAISLTVNLLGTAWQKFLDAWNGLKNKTLELKIGIADRIRSAWNTAAGKWNSSTILSALGKLPYLASGGMVDSGQLFIAREAGPELVGSMNGTTTVANNEQIVAGIQNGVAQANAEQNVLLGQIVDGVYKLLQKDLVITPSVALGQVVARSNTLYARA